MKDDKTVHERLRDILAYANIHLSADTTDNPCLYLKLCAVLGCAPAVTDGYVPDTAALEKLDDPSPLLEDFPAETAAYLISQLLPLPSKLIEIFNSVLDGGSIKEASDWFYDFCVKSGYVPLALSENNIHWQAEGGKGGLHITINTSVLYFNNNHYDCPRYLPCKNYDASPIRRELPLSLNGEDWFLRFSTHSLFPQHFIFCPETPTPVKDYNDTFGRLIDAAEYFPHYFFSKNVAAMNGCGQKNHLCFAGGLPELPLFFAPPRMAFDEPDKQVRITVPDWYSTVIRLESFQRRSILEAATRISGAWESYSNKGLGIINGPPQKNNYAASIVRINEKGEYCADLILYSPRIKPENSLFNLRGIGVFESAGVFILPAVTAKAAEAARACLCGETPLTEILAADQALSPYAGLLEDIISKASGASENAAADIESYIRAACEDALKATAVFKEDGAGNIALIEFMSNLDFAPAK